MNFDFYNDPVIVRKGSYVKVASPLGHGHDQTSTLTQGRGKSTALVSVGGPPVVHPNKNFVFDLDETIGSFTDLDILWRGLVVHGHMKDKNADTDHTFCQLLDLYPEFLRYGILTILEFLYFKKRRGECNHVYIYTNNQCPGDWTWRIITYLEKTGHMPGLVDQIICAFKIGGKIIEEKRTSQTKSFSDFVRCTLLPKNADICFIDNTYFPKMKHARVFYIQPKPYYHSLGLDEILDRFVRSPLGQDIVSGSGLSKDQWKQSMWDWSVSQGCSVEPRVKTTAERELDILVSQRLMYYLKDFFYMSMRKPKTRKIVGKFWRDRTKKNRG